MLFLVFTGVLSCVFGVLFIFAPDALKGMSDKVNKIMLSFDEKFYELRMGVGISLLLVSVMCFFVAYYVYKRYAF